MNRALRNKIEEIINSIVFSTTQEDIAFIGHILQICRIEENKDIPTAGVGVDIKLNCLKLVVNSDFFMGKEDVKGSLKTDAERKAVFIHEMYHVLYGHLYMYTKHRTTKDSHKRLNFAMDLVINQMIRGLPSFALKPEHFKDKNGVQFPPHLSTEQYYDMLEDASYQNPNGGGGDGEPQTLDSHMWDEMTQEELGVMKDAVRRAADNYEKKYGNIPGSVRDFLERVGKFKDGRDKKRILHMALKKSLPSFDVRQSWDRVSRRFGANAKGNSESKMPSIRFYGDTSGSISTAELNSFLDEMESFFKVGVKQSTLCLWHTELYYTQDIKKNKKLDASKVESGGTDIQGVFDDIVKFKPELAIIMTDGYYGMPNITKAQLGFTKVVFLIKEGIGTKDHPTKELGSTFFFK